MNFSKYRVKPGSKVTLKDWDAGDKSAVPADKAMRVKQLEGGNKIADFECETEGTPCEIKTGGKKATVSLWFNGAMLVEMETKGTEVVKRRFKILPAGDSMEMEVIPIVPSGKTETFGFKRAQLASR